MTDPDVFEARFAAAFARYTDAAVTDYDAVAIARRVAAGDRRAGGAPWARSLRLDPALAGLAAAALLAAVAVAAALLASRSDDPPRRPEPLMPSGISVLNSDDGSYGGLVADAGGALWMIGDGRLVRLDPSTGASRTWTPADDAAFSLGGLNWYSGSGWLEHAVGLSPARGGGVWLFHDRGLRWFDTERFRDVVEAPESVRRLAEAPDGSLWVATVGGEILRWDGSTWTHHGSPDPSDRPLIDAMAVGRDGRLWIGGADMIARYDGSSWVTAATGYHCSPLAIEPLPDGTARAVTGEGLGVFDGSAWRVTAPAAWPEGPEHVAFGPDGDIWVAGDPRFVSHFDGRSWTWGSAEVPAGPGGGFYEGLAATRHGVYLLTGHDGIQELSDGRWEPVPGLTDSGWNQGQPRTSPGSVAMTGAQLAVSRGELWAVTGDGPWHFAGGGWIHEGSAELEGDTRGLALAPDGTVWAAGTDGVSYRREGQWTNVDPSNATAVFVDDQGTVWAGGPGGVWSLRHDGTRWVREALPGHPLPTVTSLALDRRAILWAGAPGGLARFDGAGWKTIGEVEGSRVASATVLGTAPDGKVWVEAWAPAAAQRSATKETGALRPWAVHMDASDSTALEAPDGTCGLALAADGTVWASTEQGPAFLDGRTWTHPWADLSLGCANDTPQTYPRAPEIAVAADGTLFVNHEWGIWSFTGRPATAAPNPAP